MDHTLDIETEALTDDRREGVPWGTRLLAALGFLLALLVGGLIISRQVALARAESYLRDRYGASIELPVKRVRADLLSGPTSTGKPLPPLGFCWTVELKAGGIEAEVMLNPWTHQIVDWRSDL